MKLKKVAFVLSMLTLFSVVTASAVYAEDVFTCRITKVGSSIGEWTWIELESVGNGQNGEPGFAARWFRYPVDREKEFLAVALTAMSLGRNVTVTANQTTAFISNIFINQQ